MSNWIPNLDGRTGPKYLQIVEALAEDVAAGTLAPGTRLLPYRELAYQLGISANTTSRAYAEAVRRALLRGEVGRGTFVRSPDPRAAGDAPNTLRRAATGPIDLSRNLPLQGFAEPHIRRALAEISEEPGLSALLDYQADDDLARHIEAAGHWLAHCGVAAPAGEIVVAVGAQHGLLCMLMALLRPGDLLLTETLTYMPVCAMGERLGLKTAGVEMDADGIIPESFEDRCRHANPRAFYLTPTLQSPTTVTLSDARRQAIAEIARRHDVILIEDDVFGPLKADRPAPLATRAPDHTVYVTSLSKSVAPGLRVGFLRAPEHLVPALRHAVNLSVWMTPPLTLEIATRLIRDRTAMDLAGQQRAAAERRQALARSILSNVDVVTDPQGLHIWLPLPDGLRADVFRAQCARHGILVSEARNFALRPGDAPEAVRVCLSHEADEARLARGLRTMANLLHGSTNRYVLEL
ncbi:MAG: PLP-dependent aminotransferase family protein [Rhodobiaceae bacterium]|nr:PLP-dependent aminotransferase family protein [Rhodobiaceae bacterium]